MPQKGVSLFWFRRDLRLEDNAGLYYALKENPQVLPIFIFDTEILNQLEEKNDRRVDFIHQAIQSLQKQLLQLGTSLKVFYCQPIEAFASLIKNYSVTKVYTNHDYEPYAIARDEAIKTFLKANNIELSTFKDQCVFEKNEVLKDDGKPYTVFTPYSRKWKFHLKPFYYKAYPTTKYAHHFLKTEAFKMLGLKEMGFNKTDITFTAPSSPDNLLLEKYKEQRDYPAIAGTSRLSMHLRFGTISIRALVSKSLTISETWLNELIWRDFYMMILWHFPHAAKEAFKKDYNQIVWRNNESEFEKWCKGQTGFPIVDAGMRELNNTGFMHNRVRMIVSSFLVKDLLIDWRWGEAYFAQKLNDFDLSANNGGWQWAAGTGCDAAPYFRVFNPSEQQKKFDPEFKYIKKWVPEYGTTNYPLPMVDHAMARNRALATYKKGLQKQAQTELGLF